MRGGNTRTVALAVVIGLGAGACSGAGPSETRPPVAESEAAEVPPVPARFSEQRLAWDECPAPTPLQGSGDAPGAEWECATLTVPLDYDAPGSGETVEIAVVRKPATGGERLGSLVFNFGGPGGSGVAALPRAEERYAELGERYDLVSFDPRGVGASSPVVCRTDAEIDAAAQRNDGPPVTEEEELSYLSRAYDYARACEAAAGPLLPHLTTVDAARDLDLLRRALGDERLNYFGVSYGTKLGAVHAHLFPEHVGRTVFDAVVDPTRDVVRRALLQTQGFQLALDHYLDACVPNDGCPTEDELAALFERLRERPLPTDGGRRLTQGLAVTAVLGLLYSESSWPTLTEGVRQAGQDGRGDVLLAAAERYNGRDEQGRYRNLHAANTAVNCADFASRPDVADVRAHEPAFVEASPVFGPHLVWSLLDCAYWPVAGERDQPEVSAPGAGPILLVGTVGDPATPYVGAERMRAALGEGVGVLLTYEGEGHGGYQGGDACVVETVNAYLLAGTTPRDGTVCP
ncbi:alpha/beta hydrolase [Streptomyces sp. 8K308]|uniref:alpha/beta hydrolase n=1 Tax=Streptomyces sp. 8K308 TaxID=2530388 RepID=UPI001049B403|nr:alpha/beta hydrolase [Streptomyces sp. 8K308]TDC07316.1 alpha/beta hydrolase [Streptomyces sp. 8K308]